VQQTLKQLLMLKLLLLLKKPPLIWRPLN